MLAIMQMSVLAAVHGAAVPLLWIVGLILIIAGVVALVRGSLLAGIVLIIIGCLVGPGGYSIFK